MIKILFMFVSLVNVLHNYEITFQDEKEETLESIGDYDFLTNGELCYKKQCIYSFDKFENVALALTEKGVITLILNNGYASIYVFDDDTLIKEKRLSNKYEYIKLDYALEKVYVYGQISFYQDEKFLQAKKTYFDGNDAFIAILDENYEFSQVSIFGGYEDEGFLSLRINENGFYLFGKKSPLSGGDFGNTYGDNDTYYLTHLNFNFKLINFLTFKDESYLDYRLFHDEIYVAMKDNIYILSYDLELEYSLKIPSPLNFGYFSYNYSFVGINGLEANICNLKNKKWTSYTLAEGDHNLQKVIIRKNKFLLIYQERIKQIGIYDMSNFKKEIYNGEEQGRISNMFTELEVQEVVYPEYFNPQIYGEYKANFIYEGVSKEGKVIVEKEVNIREDGVYPLGYRLLFTGVAYLDSVLINNNHPLLTKGYHELVLVNNIGVKEKIGFYVETQIEFVEEKNKNFDFEVYPYEDFTFTLTLNCREDTKINYVVINDEKIKEVTFNYPYLQITLQDSQVGTSIYHLTKLNYNDNQDIIMDYVYRVRVLQNNFSLYGSFEDADKYLSYQGELTDTYRMARYLKFTIKKGARNRIKYIL